MKRALRISVIVIATIGLLLLGTWLMRNIILRYSLETVISNKTNHKIALDLEGVELKLRNGNVFLIKPELQFTDFYLDEAETRKLTSLAFDSISIISLSLKELLFDRKFISGGLVVERPAIRFTERAGTESTSFHPDRLIEALSVKPAGDNKINIKIEDIEIHYGSIDLKSDTTIQNIPELVDFSIVLRNFNTLPTPEQKKKQLFFSDDILFRIENLKQLFVSGYNLNIGSVLFSSGYEILTIHDASLTPNAQLTEGKNTIAIAANLIEMRGMDLKEARGLKDVQLSAFVVSDGYVTTSFQSPPGVEKDTSHRKGLKQISKILHQFKLDTMSIGDFNYYQVHEDYDTLAAINEIDFEMFGVEIDSSMFDNMYRDFIFDESKLSTGEFKIKIRPDDLIVTAERFKYLSVDETVIASGLKIENDTNLYSDHNLSIHLQEFAVGGVSAKHILKPQKLYLKTLLKGLVAEIDLDHKIFKPNKTKQSNWQDLIDLTKIRLEDGSVNVFNKNDFLLILNGINTEIDSLKIGENEGNKVNYTQFTFRLDDSETNLIKTKQQFKTGPIVINENLLSINNLRSKLKAGNKIGGIGFQNFSMTSLDLKKLMNEEILVLDDLTLNGLNITGEFDFSALKREQKPNTDNKSKPIPFQLIDLNNIELINATFDMHVLDDEPLHIKSKLNAHFDNLFIDESDDQLAWLSQLGGSAKLSETEIRRKNQGLALEELIIDLSDSLFSIQYLNMNEKTVGTSVNQQPPGNVINLESIDISGLDYNLLLKDDSIQFRKLYVLNPEVNWSVHQEQVRSDSVDTSYLSVLDQLLKISYDTVELAGLNLKFEHKDDSSHALVHLDKLNLGHHYYASKNSNFFDELIFTFKHFSFMDSVKKQFTELGEGRYDANKRQLIFSDVTGGNLTSTGIKSDMNYGSSYFRSPEIVLSGIYLTDKLPAVLNISKLNLDSLQLSLSDQRHKSKKPGLSLDASYLKRYAKFMTRLSIDTTQLNNISFHYRNVDDTTVHAIFVDSIGIRINKFNVDTNFLENEELYMINNLMVDLKGRTRVTKDSLYSMETGMIHYNFPERTITIDSFFVLPRYNDSDFFKKAVYQTDKMDLFTEKIELKDFHIKELFEKDHIHFGSIDIHNIDLDMVRDKRYPMKPDIHKNMPQSVLREIKRKFTIDSVRVIDSKLRYGEYSEKSELPGDVLFERSHINAYNITNNFYEIDKQSSLKIDFDAYVENDARVWVSLIFPLKSEQDEFWMTGGSETIDLTKLNRLTENVLGVAITSGKGSIDIPLISGNDLNSLGKVTFRYKKLKLKLYDREKHKMERGFFSGFMNFMINDLLLKSNNPRFARKVREGQVYFERDTEKAVINYVWKSVLSGMLSTMGINTKEQRQERREQKKDLK